MLTLQSFSYSLPAELIAHTPSSPRTASRVLFLDRHTSTIKHHHFYDVPTLLKSGDVLVRNDTKVFPARLMGSKPTGGKVEILLLHQDTSSDNIWECLTKPGLKVNQELNFPPSQLTARCIKVTDRTRHIHFSQAAVEFIKTLEILGQTPLPPYISNPASETEKRNMYQTTYAQRVGSAAAPTAGLHFTPQLDHQLLAKGVTIETVTLHVGLGTFQRIKTQDVTKHPMHYEWYSLDQQTADRLNLAKSQGRRIIAIGTTTCRVLESCAQKTGQLQAQSGQTNLFIYPPYQFRIVDGLITNFHLPESTLLLLVSAFVTQPNTEQPFSSFTDISIGKAYQTAMQQNYRFFSFGDAMLIL